MTPPHRQLGLDVLRGMAILLVVGAHLEYTRPDGVLGVVAGAWHRMGWVGVDLFFVLSGYLISGLLLRELARHDVIRLGRFLVRRGLKIYPAYFVFLAYVMFKPVLDAGMGGESIPASLAAQWSAGWPNLLFLQNYVGDNPWQHTWSLAVEDHFYLVMPLVLAALAAAGWLRILPRVALILVGLCLLLRTATIYGDPSAAGFVYQATHLRCDALLLGVALRIVLEHEPHRIAWLTTRPVRAIMIGLALWVPTVLFEWSSPAILSIGLAATGLGAVAIVAGALHWGSTASGLRPVARGVGWVGIASYSIYLWHVTAIRIVESRLGPPIERLIDSPNLRWLAVTTCAVAGSVAIGTLATYVVERPVLVVRDRLWPSRSGVLTTAPSREPAALATIGPERRVA